MSTNLAETLLITLPNCRNYALLLVSVACCDRRGFALCGWFSGFEKVRIMKKVWSVESHDIADDWLSFHTYVNATEEETVEELRKELACVFPGCFIVETDAMYSRSSRDSWERYFVVYDSPAMLTKLEEVRLSEETRFGRLFDVI